MRRQHRSFLSSVSFCLSILSVLAGCEVEEDACATGQLGCACDPAGACNEGLTCRNQVCQREPGADAGADAYAADGRAATDSTACQADCSNRQCGPDPVCGQLCGLCPAGQQCTQGQCRSDVCQPQCAQRQCGDDGCGGTCGLCAAGQVCVSAACVAQIQGGPQLASEPPQLLMFGSDGQCLESPLTSTIRLLNVGDQTLRIDRICLAGDWPTQPPWQFIVHLDATSADVFDPVSGQTLPQLGPADIVASAATSCPTGLPLDGQSGRPGPIVLEPAASFLLPVSYDPDPAASGPVQAQLSFLGNMPETAPLHLMAQPDTLCLAVDPAQIDFGSVLVGTSRQVTLELSNCGSAALNVSQVSFSSGSAASFMLVGVEGGDALFPLTLLPGEVSRITLAYLPAAPAPEGPDGTLLAETATLLVENDSCSPQLQIPLRGIGVEQAGPVAVIACDEGVEAVPQTVLHLHGDDSYGAGGTGDIARWQWTVDQPVGSQSTFVPSATFPNPTFEANVAGTYTFYLDVWDANDGSSAIHASHTVTVVPDVAVHVELLWTTPGDDDETDTGPYSGSDLDLHFTHPDAPSDPYAQDFDGDGLPDPYFDNPWDCFWFNPRPDWGSTDPSLDDNPSLDRDDTDGAGPENINLAEPEQDTTYRIAVHAWDDHGFGPSYATLRVYVFSELAYEISDVRLDRKDLWCAATLQWPSGLILPCSAPDGSTPWITPNYENPNFTNP